MPQSFSEGQLSFDFPDAWHVCRLQDTSFYIRHFQGFCGQAGGGGCKEMDFLAYDPVGRVLWLIEVKDYRVEQRTKPIELSDEVALKVRDSLALLRVAPIRDLATSDAGRLQAGDFAQRSGQATTVRVVLHCELPSSPSRLFPGIRDRANLQQKLATTMRSVDPHAVFVDKSSKRLPWTVR